MKSTNVVLAMPVFFRTSFKIPHSGWHGSKGNIPVLEFNFIAEYHTQKILLLYFYDILDENLFLELIHRF
mgnify:CR=1 FL=1